MNLSSRVLSIKKKHAIRLNILTAVFLLLFSLLYTSVQCRGAAGEEWLSGWNYRKGLVINATDGESSYTVRMVLENNSTSFDWIEDASFGHITPYKDNPIIGFGEVGAWNETGVGERSNTLYKPGDTGFEFKQWWSTSPFPYNGYNIYLAYAYSSNGINWTVQQCSVSNVPADRKPFEDPTVVEIDGIYYMYAETKKPDGRYDGISLLTSVDGLTWSWQKYALPLGTQTWEDECVGSPIVWTEDSTWYMLYEGYAQSSTIVGQIGLATSTDGLNWTRNRNNPVFKPTGISGTFDNVTVVTHDIIKVGDTYYLSYHGQTGKPPNKIGIAKSTDLLNWTRINNGNPILTANDLYFFPNMTNSSMSNDDRIIIQYIVPNEGSNLGYIYRDNGNTVYIEGHQQTDFSEIFFTSFDGVTGLNYWLESKVDGEYAIFSVNVTASPGSQNETIYIYYGKIIPTITGTPTTPTPNSPSPKPSPSPSQTASQTPNTTQIPSPSPSPLPTQENKTSSEQPSAKPLSIEAIAPIALTILSVGIAAVFVVKAIFPIKTRAKRPSNR